MSTSLMPTYARQPVAFVRGEGIWLEDEHGRRYLDALSGIAVCGLGHAHPRIAAAIAEQAQTLIHTSNLYRIPLQEKLAAELCTVSGMTRCFFANSGAEANEGALKLARLHGHRRGIARPAVLVMENSFHGRTLATLSATGNVKVQKGFEPLVDGFIRVPFDDIAAIEKAAQEHPEIVAILVEPIQGESGVRLPAQGLTTYLSALRQLCDRHDWLLMLDEVQTGNGRTGRYFAFQHSPILPDVVSTAKGLGNGFPIAAVLVAGKASDLFGPGMHGTTFGGSPLACRVALCTIELLRDGAMDNAARVGAALQQSLTARLQGLDIEVTGLGMMIGIILPGDATPLIERGREAGLLFAVSAERRIRLLPPLIMNDSEAEELSERLSRLIRDFLTPGGVA